jgi:hypothetical protein
MEYWALMTSVGADSDERTEGLKCFLDDGRESYLTLLALVHDDQELSRAEAKRTDRWLKFSRKSQKKLRRDLPFDPFETTDESGDLRITLPQGRH